jgi:hypothetical protein
MRATELLADLIGQGSRLAVWGEGIEIAPAKKLSDGQRRAVREHKGELRALLGAGVPTTLRRPRRSSTRSRT